MAHVLTLGFLALVAVVRPLDAAVTEVKLTPAEVQSLLTETGKGELASVDGDPDFIVGVRGLDQPLCFRLEGQPGHVVRLLQDPDTGVIVNARISRPVPGSHKTYLSAVLISRRNFRVVVKVGRILVNRYRFHWGPVSVRLVHGHRVLIAPTLLALTLRNQNVTLVVKRHLPEGRLLVNGTDTNSTNGSSAPNTAPGTPGPDLAQGPHQRNRVVTPGRRTHSRRGSRRRRPDDVDRGLRWSSRRHRRRGEGGRRRDRPRGRNNSTSAARARSKRYVINQEHFVLTGFLHPSTKPGGRLSRPRRQSSNDNPSVRSAANGRGRRGHWRRQRTPNTHGQRSGGGGGSGDGVDPALQNASSDSPSRDMVTYVGFYVADARDLSSRTHGLLGQFLYKVVTLQRVRQKSNGVMKARLLVERPRPHQVRATRRTRTNMALNSSSTCWWLREGGVGVVDGVYEDYLLARFRDTDPLPLPPGPQAQ